MTTHVDSAWKDLLLETVNVLIRTARQSIELPNSANYVQALTSSTPKAYANSLIFSAYSTTRLVTAKRVEKDSGSNPTSPSASTRTLTVNSFSRPRVTVSSASRFTTTTSKARFVFLCPLIAWLLIFRADVPNACSNLLFFRTTTAYS